MLSINWSDVVSVLELIRPYLIAFGIIFVLAVIVILAVKKVQEPKRYLIRSQSRVAVAIALVVIVNLICTGPMSTLLTLVSGSGTITPETQETAEAVLRGEWGYHGFVLTDYFAGFGYMDAQRSIYYGGDTCLANYDAGTNYVQNTDSATTVQHMRDASHNIMYTVVNSRAYEPENMQTGLLLYQIILIAADIIAAVLIILYEGIRVRKVYAKRKETA